ncbi:15473_t:CDS:2 [Dentiscutata heterogama]|uniref:15473_t:CDS:1 n=1 Tax=Dentiscutata heterogama TaxID=1316150 RepID=A0ACA9L000_9GLOM|nr:15473_t:CDS:2 [Dentiscutata heterogama]
MENIDYNDSDSESVDEIENFSILNFNNDTYQNIKDKILQLDGDDNEDYDLNILDEFVDQVINIDDHVVPDQHEQTWALSEQIYNTFQNSDPNSHSLFDYTTQNTTKGFFNIETCYQHRIERMQNLLAKEVYLTKKKKSKRRGIKNLDDTQSKDNAQNDNNTQNEDE